MLLTCSAKRLRVAVSWTPLMSSTAKPTYKDYTLKNNVIIILAI